MEEEAWKNGGMVHSPYCVHGTRYSVHGRARMVDMHGGMVDGRGGIVDILRRVVDTVGIGAGYGHGWLMEACMALARIKDGVPRGVW